MNELQMAQACVDKMLEKDEATRGLGMTVEVIEPGIARTSMIVGPAMVNGFDVCHGAFIFAVADSAFAFACNAYNDVTVASGATIDFLMPALLGDTLTAKAHEVRRGRRAGIYDIEVRNQDDGLVAIFRGRSASLGRAALHP